MLVLSDLNNETFQLKPEQGGIWSVMDRYQFLFALIHAVGDGVESITPLGHQDHAAVWESLSAGIVTKYGVSLLPQESGSFVISK